MITNVTVVLGNRGFRRIVGGMGRQVGRVRGSLPRKIIVRPFVSQAGLISQMRNAVTHGLVRNKLVIVFMLIVFLNG